MKSEPRRTIPVSKRTLPVADRDHVQGAIDAPISLLEYGDYECPYCGEARPVIKALQEQLGDRLCFAFRNFPLSDIHPHAERAAEAAEAAGAQGRFWEMHDLLFENQEALEDQDLARYALALGLDAKRLIGEVQTRAHAARLQEDSRNGTISGVNGTPTFFINGLSYDGETDVADMLEALVQAVPR